MDNKNPHADSRRRKSVQLLAALALLLLSTASAAAQDAPKIQWELVNPFRFIKRDSMDEIRSVYDRLAKKTASELESELQRLSEDAVESDRAKARSKFDCAKAKSDEEKRQCFEPYRGWFARLAADNYRKTCWDSANHQFRKGDDECKDYIFPKTHKVRVWLTDLKLSSGRVPVQWLVDGQQPPHEVFKCATKSQKDFCAEFDVDDNVAQPRARTLSVRFSDGSLLSAPDKLLVQDLLVVGLGDSYASGEGNPDIPAQFTRGERELDTWPGRKPRTIFMPQRDDGTKARWLDERCHRSMYSYQFKTALRLALADPQRAVTYVSYACSGATTDNIIDKRQRPKEGIGLVSKQLEALREVLADGNGGQREIDYLLLSTGGNDIHFAKYVAYIILSGEPLKLFSRIVNDDTLKDNPAEFREKLLTGKGKKKGNYPKLYAALLDEKNGIKIKGCRADKPCPRILLTVYPNIFQDENGKTCRADRMEFDTQFGSDENDKIKRKERIELVKQHVYDPLQSIQRDSASALGWTIVTEQTDTADKYLIHGFCARDGKSQSATGENFVVPTRGNGKWQSFDPWDYKSYEARGRWIRLPVDAKLTTDQAKLSDWARSLLKELHLPLPQPLERIRVDLFFEDDRANIMHPTAEAHAVTADANVSAIQSLEGKAP